MAHRIINTLLMILFQPFFDTFGSTRITRAHHVSIVYNHAFPIDDKEVGDSLLCSAPINGKRQLDILPISTL